MNDLILKCAKDLNRYYPKEDVQMAQRYIKRCSTSLCIKELQIKTTMKYYFTSTKMVIIKRKKRKISIGENVEKLEPLYIAGWYVNWGSCCEKVCCFLNKLNKEVPHDPTIPLLGMYRKELKTGI